MNKQNIIAIVDISNNDIKTVHAIDEEFISNMNKIVDDKFKWLMKRTGFVGRKNIRELMNHIGAFDRENLIQISKGISINDTLWLNEIDNQTSWKDVNPYTNSFSEAISNLALNCNYNGGNLNTPSVEYTIDGAYSKCCKRVNHKTVMVKASHEKFSSITGNESSSEVLCNQLCEYLDIPKSDYVRYNLTEKRTESGFIKAYTTCELFTNQQIGFIPFGDSIYNKLDVREQVELFDKGGYGEKFRNMLILDCITYNTDRHAWNYGFLIDNNTFKVRGLAPIFDNNLSCLHNVSFSKNPEDIRYDISIKESKFSCSFEELLALTLYNGFKERVIQARKKYGEFKIDTKRTGSLEHYRCKFLEQLIRNRLNSITKF